MSGQHIYLCLGIISTHVETMDLREEGRRGEGIKERGKAERRGESNDSLLKK